MKSLLPLVSAVSNGWSRKSFPFWQTSVEYDWRQGDELQGHCNTADLKSVPKKIEKVKSWLQGIERHNQLDTGNSLNVRMERGSMK